MNGPEERVRSRGILAFNDEPEGADFDDWVVALITSENLDPQDAAWVFAQAVGHSRTCAQDVMLAEIPEENRNAVAASCAGSIARFTEAWAQRWRTDGEASLFNRSSW